MENGEDTNAGVPVALPREYTHDEVARAMMSVCEQFSHKYPGTIFMFVSGQQQDGNLVQMGLSTNLENTEAAMHFFKLILMQQEEAQMRAVTEQPQEPT